jgi:hypothetical protein
MPFTNDHPIEVGIVASETPLCSLAYTARMRSRCSRTVALPRLDIGRLIYQSSITTLSSAPIMRRLRFRASRNVVRRSSEFEDAGARFKLCNRERASTLSHAAG